MSMKEWRETCYGCGTENKPKMATCTLNDDIKLYFTCDDCGFEWESIKESPFQTKYAVPLYKGDMR